MRALASRLLLTLLVSAAVPVAAQDTPPAPPPPPPQIRIEPGTRPQRTRPQATPTGRAALDLASSYLSAGEVDRAIALLEDLYAARPGSGAVWAKLGQAYVAGRRFDDALRLVDERIARDGATVETLTEKGAALYRLGRPDDATRVWQEAIALSPDAPLTYRRVSNTVGGLRLYDEAADILAQGTARLGDAALFRLERAHLYGLAGDVPQAAAAYLDVVVDDPSTARSLQNRLERILTDEAKRDEAQAVLDDRVRQHPLNAGLRQVAAWLALERGDYDAALTATRAADRIAGGDGREVYRFAQTAQASGALDAAGRALDDLLSRYADGPLAPAATLERARLSERRAEAAGERPGNGSTPLTDAARDGYAAFAEAYPNHPETPDALQRLADLQLHAYRDADAAEQTLRLLTTRSTNPSQIGEADLELGAVALQRGDLFVARERYAAAEDRLRTGPLAERARYELALLDFYEGYLYSALARAEAMDDDTAADVANDAVSLRLTLDENAGPDSTNAALRTYGRAALLHRRGLHDDALVTLDSLAADAPSHPLADEVLVLRAAAARALGRTADALALLERVPAEHPLSYLRDRALFQAAEIYEAEGADPAAALDAYGRLLDRYPGSLLAPRARERLRALRAAQPDS